MESITMVLGFPVKVLVTCNKQQILVYLTFLLIERYHEGHEIHILLNAKWLSYLKSNLAESENKKINLQKEFLLYKKKCWFF